MWGVLKVADASVAGHHLTKKNHQIIEIFEKIFSFKRYSPLKERKIAVSHACVLDILHGTWVLKMTQLTFGSG